MKIKLLALAIVCAGLMSTASAQVTKTIVQKNYHEKERVKQGVKSGELTAAETKVLLKNQKEIHQEVKGAKADGVVTADEKHDIKIDKRKQSRRTVRLKHNDRDRN